MTEVRRKRAERKVAIAEYWRFIDGTQSNMIQNRERLFFLAAILNKSHATMQADLHEHGHSIEFLWPQLLKKRYKKTLSSLNSAKLGE